MLAYIYLQRKILTSLYTFCLLHWDHHLYSVKHLSLICLPFCVLSSPLSQTGTGREVTLSKLVMGAKIKWRHYVQLLQVIFPKKQKILYERFFVFCFFFLSTEQTKEANAKQVVFSINLILVILDLIVQEAIGNTFTASCPCLICCKMNMNG